MINNERLLLFKPQISCYVIQTPLNIVFVFFFVVVLVVKGRDTENTLVGGVQKPESLKVSEQKTFL